MNGHTNTNDAEPKVTNKSSSVSCRYAFLIPSRYDIELDKHYTVDNDTGERIVVNSRGYRPMIYDLIISGVASTKQRNVLAGNVDIIVTYRETFSNTKCLKVCNLTKRSPSTQNRPGSLWVISNILILGKDKTRFTRKEVIPSKISLHFH